MVNVSVAPLAKLSGALSSAVSRITVVRPSGRRPAAEKTTPDLVNFMAAEGRGLIYVSLTEERARRLDLPPMVRDEVANGRSGFAVSIEAREGVSTGISAADRAATVLAAVAQDAVPLETRGRPLRACRRAIDHAAGD